MIEHVHLDSLTEDERTVYENGEWLLPTPVPSWKLEGVRRRSTAPDKGWIDVAEMLARIDLEREREA